MREAGLLLTIVIGLMVGFFIWYFSEYHKEKGFPIIPLLKPERQNYGNCAKCANKRTVDALKWLKKRNPNWPY